MLFLTCLAARFSGLCQENVKPEPDGTKAARQGFRRKNGWVRPRPCTKQHRSPVSL